MVSHSSCLPDFRANPLPTLKRYACDTQIVSEIPVNVSNIADICNRSPGAIWNGYAQRHAHQDRKPQDLGGLVHAKGMRNPYNNKINKKHLTNQRQISIMFFKWTGNPRSALGFGEYRGFSLF